MSTKGIRNNNAGNIRVSKDQWQGAVGQDADGFVVFETPEHGIRALGKNLLSYQRQGFDSVEKIINRWAPPQDNNDTESYINFVVNSTGFTRDQQLDMNDPSVLSALTKAIMVQENGAANINYTDDQVSTGISMALGQEGITPKSKPIGKADFSYLIEGIEAQPKVKLGEGLAGTVGVNLKGEEPRRLINLLVKLIINQQVRH